MTHVIIPDNISTIRAKNHKMVNYLPFEFVKNVLFSHNACRKTIHYCLSVVWAF